MHLNVGENLKMDYKPKAVYDVFRCAEGIQTIDIQLDPWRR